MLGKLLKKEFLLTLHPTSILFIFFAMFVFIPNYPYEVMFFFIGLSVFFVCLTGRENGDLAFTCNLPVGKGDVAKARILMCVCIQLAQLLLVTALVTVKSAFLDMPNLAGMDANAVTVGMGLLINGLFNLTFFPKYFKNPTSIGKPFLIASLVSFVVIAVEICCCFALPFVRDVLDTPDPLNIGAKLAATAVCAVVYAACTFLACRLSVKNFQKTDL